MGNRFIKAISKNKEVRMYLINSTDMVENSRKIYGSTPISTAALGRTITAASILGKTLKNKNDKFTLRIKGSNKIESILAVSDYKGTVKGYISDPFVETIVNKNGKLDIGNAVGKEGKIFIIRDYGLKEPYVGSADLVSGEIADDLANYFMYSEQQPTVFSLGVFVNTDGIVEAAGGLLIQTMPDITEETIIKIEESFSKIKPISTLINEKNSLEDIIKDNFESLEFEIIEITETKLSCDCSRERMEKALISLGKDEINDMIKKDKGAELHCHFCNTYYKFSENDLKNIIKQ
ncbi:MAG: Hsp33 family molecular chaperone HslO [Bacillota bacterium]|nr:Hsp33 family molecular chaperone HslO [Bacillota bacterium]